MIVFWLGGMSGAVPAVGPAARGCVAGGGGGEGYAIVAELGGGCGCAVTACGFSAVGGAIPIIVWCPREPGACAFGAGGGGGLG